MNKALEPHPLTPSPLKGEGEKMKEGLTPLLNALTV
jgi:hypothetical protein